jgi:hypothetical protein
MVDPREVEGVKYLVLSSPPRWPIIETRNFVECSIVIWKCAYNFGRERRIQLFSYELCWIQEVWRVLKSLIGSGVEI